MSQKISYFCLLLFFVASISASNTVRTPLGQVRSKFIVRVHTQSDAIVALGAPDDNQTSWTATTSTSTATSYAGSLSNTQLTSLASSLASGQYSITNLTASQIFEALTVIPVAADFGVSDLPPADEHLQVNISSFEENQLSLLVQTNPVMTGSEEPPPSAILTINNIGSMLMITFSAHDAHGSYISQSLASFFINQESTSAPEAAKTHHHGKDPSASDEDGFFGCLGKFKKAFRRSNNRKSDSSSFNPSGEKSPLLGKRYYYLEHGIAPCLPYQKAFLPNLTPLDYIAAIATSMIIFASKN